MRSTTWPILFALLVGSAIAASCGDDISSGTVDGGGGSDMHATGGDMASCGLRTCASAGADCGPIGDGCGGLIDCGTCMAPQFCGGGGPSKCGGNNGCMPKTCATLGANCGPVSDGCGGMLDCGTCPTGQACGTAGANKCGPSSGMTCTPATCASLGFNCGPTGDGCGGMLNCGTSCPSGQMCGVGGKPNVCGSGVGMCTPMTCAQQGFNCGMAGDGCGNAIDCGQNTCKSPDICGGGGMPNVCGNNLPQDGGTVDASCVNLCKQQMSCSNGATTTITGTVLAPTNPSLGYGQPDPLPGALVYVPNSTVMPFGQGASCNVCGAEVTGDPLVSVTSATDGTFTLTNVPCGQNIPLVIQLGRWRRHIVIPNVACCANTQLTADQSRFPRTQGEGGDALNNIPLFALTTGSADAIECVLPKIGIDVSQFSDAGGAGRVRFYQDNGAQFSNNTPAAQQLWDSEAEMSGYDAIIFDCVGSQVNKTRQELTNAQMYANTGGRIFASHFSYVWLYNNQPWGCGNGCTTAGSTVADWNVHQGDPPDATVTVDQSFAQGKQFATWLQLVGASTTLGQVPVMNIRHDSDGFVPPGVQWLYDPLQTRNGTDNVPLELTFDTPTNVAANMQCGRVMFSDFHVYDRGGSQFPGECGQASPMTPQEKVLEYQIFQLTSCVQPFTTTCNPRTCAQANANCGKIGDGCGNLIDCGTCPQGQVCGAGKPNQCAGSMCTPETCASQGIQCGPSGDGCGNSLDCGTCPSGQTCGGGGAGKCGSGSCVPLTCAEQGLACGPAGDGCGNSLDCGTCPSGQTCGGAGVPGQCGATGCTPTTCAGAKAQCGLIGDGCGGSLDCGTCPTGQTCGGGGIPNQCGGIG